MIAGAYHRRGASKAEGTGEEAPSLVRSWLANTLVVGLLTTCAAAFELGDPQLRNMLLDGLVAGAATAFYFSSLYEGGRVVNGVDAVGFGAFWGCWGWRAALISLLPA
jgi:hypothetical protein